MKNFKLLRGEEDEELPIDDNTASWVWDSEYVDLRQFRYEIVTSQHRGILDFFESVSRPLHCDCTLNYW